MGDYARAKSGLLIPDNVSDSTEQFETVTPKMAARHSYESVWFREELKALDERLDLIFVKPGSTTFPDSPRFYILRVSEELPDQWWVIQDENGEYCKPTEAHLKRFVEGDATRNPDRREQWVKTRTDREARARKRKQELLDEFEEKLLERLDFEFDGKGLFVTGDMKEKVRSA